MKETRNTLPRERNKQYTNETPNTGNETLTNFNTVVQGSLGENNPENQLIEPSQISNEIQAWTDIFEQKNNDRIEKMKEEMDNKFEAILSEIKTNKNASTVTNPRLETNEMQDLQPLESIQNKAYRSSRI